MNCINMENCPCPKDCKNHGKCCACISHHRNINTMVFCMFAHTDGNRDDKHVYTKMKEKFEA